MHALFKQATKLACMQRAKYACTGPSHGFGPRWDTLALSEGGLLPPFPQKAPQTTYAKLAYMPFCLVFILQYTCNLDCKSQPNNLACITNQCMQEKHMKSICKSHIKTNKEPRQKRPAHASLQYSIQMHIFFGVKNTLNPSLHAY